MKRPDWKRRVARHAAPWILSWATADPRRSATAVTTLILTAKYKKLQIAGAKRPDDGGR